MADILHGGRLDAAIDQYGGMYEDWLDLSTGINPNAYPVPDLPNECWQRLPDEALVARLNRAARGYYVVPEHIGLIAGNGTQPFIQILPLVLSHQKVAVVSPTYEEHAHCWKNAGRNVLKAETLGSAVQEAEIVIIVNPNNPTAVTYQADELLNAAKQLEKKSGFLIVDEAFGDLMPELSMVPYITENIIVLRSFGKFFGLAGLRLGFAICAQSLCEELLAKLGPWSVSGPALEIGALAFDDKYWIANTRAQVKQNGKDQVEVIQVCGFELIGSAGLFMEFEHVNATGIYEALQREHILVRSFPERPTRLRFGLCKNMEELERLAWALKKYA